VELIRKFAEDDYSRALESWTFVDLAGKSPLFASPFGDLFLMDPAGVWWLDTLEGELTRRWSTTQELQEVLNTPGGQDQFLLAGLAMAADRQGLIPGATQVYGFKTPPRLGGVIDLSNVELIDFVVSVNIAGQLHAQVRALPPGTPVAGFKIDN